MSNLNCPTCNVHIDEHLASSCLNAWVATDVMGWTREKLPPQTDFGPTRRYVWKDENGEFTRAWYKRNGSMYDLVGNEAWPFSSDIAATWQVVMHLVCKHYVFALTLGTFHNAGFVHLHKGKGEGRSSYRDDNEGCLAILRAAIKARNV